MNLKKFFFIPILLFMGTLLATCSSDENLIPSPETNREKYAEYTFSVQVSDLMQLRENDSIQVKFIPEYIFGTIPEKEANAKFCKTTRSGSVLPMIGTVKDLGNKKVNFKANSGENLVPTYFTGPRKLTICRVWEISLKIDLPSSVLFRGEKGEFTGWKLQYSGNTQERHQALSGSSESPVFSTYVYKLISDVGGVNIGRDLYLPIKPEEARIYVRFSE